MCMSVSRVYVWGVRSLACYSSDHTCLRFSYCLCFLVNGTVQDYVAELESSVLGGLDEDHDSDPASASSSTSAGARAADSPDLTSLPPPLQRRISTNAGLGAASESDAVQRYRAAVLARTTVTQNSIDNANRRIMSGTVAVQEATTKVNDLNAFVALKQEDIEEARALMEVVESHRKAVTEAAGSNEGATVDATLAAMAAQAEQELALLQPLPDMHVEVDEALSELRHAQQAVAVAQAGVVTSSSTLTTLTARLATLTEELRRFNGMSAAEQLAFATAKYDEHIGQLVVTPHTTDGQAPTGPRP
jgi:hypothetical protein